ncbi:MAG TPA: LDL receptor domain-containing protein [Polyangiaceae bacterium]|nr:LDL receptor domain-containing protein [Polyangiaceae bacterium]
MSVCVLPLVGCGGSDDAETTQTGYNARLAEKLQDCGLLSEGKLSDGAGDEYIKCEQYCMLEQSCGMLEELVCNIETSDYIDAYMRYATCNDNCQELAPKFTCADGYEIPQSSKCNGYEDCSDGADETGCKSTSNGECPDGTWLSAGWICDGLKDCDDGSDEGPGCAKTLCGDEYDYE